MKKILVSICALAFLFSCNTKTETKAAAADTTAKKPMIDLPYTPSFSGNFTGDVSDADLKMVLMTYKNWEAGNMSALGDELTDSVDVEFNTGDHFNGTKADLLKRWSKTRDSLSSVSISMEAWQRSYEPDKKDAAILTWYKEIDTYKMGKVDSAYYHDINGIKDGKLSFYSQYKRPAK